MATLAAVAIAVAIMATTAHATFPGANGKIAYVTNPSDLDSYGIATVNPDGTARTRLNRTSSADQNPSFSADGSKIVYQSWGDIYVVNADDTDRRLVAADVAPRDGICGCPSFSPDGTKILFASNRDYGGTAGNADLYLINVDGTGLRRLTFDNPGDSWAYPSFSPDGTKIVYGGRLAGGGNGIHLINSDGSGHRVLTEAGAFQPSWSPDGRRILFVSYTFDAGLPGPNEIFVMDVDGSSRIRLTRTEESEDKPVWSPDGTKIAFYMNGGVNVMELDGSGRRRVAGGMNSGIDWGVATTTKTPTGTTPRFTVPTIPTTVPATTTGYITAPIITYVLPREFEDPRPWPYSRRLKLLPGGKVKLAIKSSKKGFFGKIVLKSVSTVARPEVVGSKSIKISPGKNGPVVLKLSEQAVSDVKAQHAAKFTALFVNSKSGKTTNQTLVVASK